MVDPIALLTLDWVVSSLISPIIKQYLAVTQPSGLSHHLTQKEPISGSVVSIIGGRGIASGNHGLSLLPETMCFLYWLKSKACLSFFSWNPSGILANHWKHCLCHLRYRSQQKCKRIKPSCFLDPLGILEIWWFGGWKCSAFQRIPEDTLNTCPTAM